MTDLIIFSLNEEKNYVISSEKYDDNDDENVIVDSDADPWYQW